MVRNAATVPLVTSRPVSEYTPAVIRMSWNSAIRTGTAALTGAKAVVLQRVDSDGGRVKIGGEEWSARAYMEGQVFEPGTRVEVVKIEGAIALVYN